MTTKIDFRMGSAFVRTLLLLLVVGIAAAVLTVVPPVAAVFIGVGLFLLAQLAFLKIILSNIIFITEATEEDSGESESAGEVAPFESSLRRATEVKEQSEPRWGKGLKA